MSPASFVILCKTCPSPENNNQSKYDAVPHNERLARQRLCAPISKITVWATTNR
jgi:hypothetical protein